MHLDMTWGILHLDMQVRAALNAVNPDGFAHYKQSVRVVQTVLEKNGEGLNLTWEVRDGMLNHRTSGTPYTLEGQVVRLVIRLPIFIMIWMMHRGRDFSGR